MRSCLSSMMIVWLAWHNIGFSETFSCVSEEINFQISMTWESRSGTASAAGPAIQSWHPEGKDSVSMTCTLTGGSSMKPWWSCADQSRSITATFWSFNSNTQATVILKKENNITETYNPECQNQ